MRNVSLVFPSFSELSKNKLWGGRKTRAVSKVILFFFLALAPIFLFIGKLFLLLIWASLASFLFIMLVVGVLI